MPWKMDGHSRKIAFGLIVSGVVSVGVLSFTAGILGIRVNTSYSLPLGLYIGTTDSAAALIEFCAYLLDHDRRGDHAVGLPARDFCAVV